MPHMRTLRSALALFLLVGCQPAQEAPRFELPLVVDERGIETTTNDLGFDIALSEARVAVSDFQFTTAGELHTASLPERLWSLVVPSAFAHPGHYEGGEVIGEAQGHFLVDWFGEDRHELGTATLITGSYTSVNFTFARAGMDDDLAGNDPLLGHTARFAGVASKDGDDFEFEIVVDSPEDRQLVGVPFEAEIDENSELSIGFELVPHDDLGEDNLFDGLDFAALDTNEDGEVYLSPDSTDETMVDAYNVFHRTFQTHNHYFFAAIAEDE